LSFGPKPRHRVVAKNFSRRERGFETFFDGLLNFKGGKV
jgi:hypothetical protein